MSNTCPPLPKQPLLICCLRSPTTHPNQTLNHRTRWWVCRKSVWGQAGARREGQVHHEGSRFNNRQPSHRPHGPFHKIVVLLKKGMFNMSSVHYDNQTTKQYKNSPKTLLQKAHETNEKTWWWGGTTDRTQVLPPVPTSCLSTTCGVHHHNTVL